MYEEIHKKAESFIIEKLSDPFIKIILRGSRITLQVDPHTGHIS